MEKKRERAHDIAEEGLDKLVEGDKEAGEKLIDKAKKIDPKAVEELAEEVERDKENAERFVEQEVEKRLTGKPGSAACLQLVAPDRRPYLLIPRFQREGGMKENRVKRILSEGGLALGTHVGGIADPQIVEIIGLAGFDAAFIDMEHTSYDLHDVQLAVMAAERVGITPIVRTPGFDPAFILRLLDMGVQGIQVPHVSSAETAREAVKAVRYPPLGERGMAAGSRAADYGRIPLVEHMAQSNREILLACMIEDMAAVERIDEIAAVEGVDLLAVGPVRPVALARRQRPTRSPEAGRCHRPRARRGQNGRRRPARLAAQPCRISA